jgi:hypothetical protein
MTGTIPALAKVLGKSGIARLFQKDICLGGGQIGSRIIRSK